MNWEKVSSSFIREMAWEKNVMYVKMKNGSVYAYGASESLYRKIKCADSIGQALNESKLEGKKL